MPIYEYGCQQCGHDFEEMQKFSDPPVERCPECGSLEAQRKVSVSAFHLNEVDSTRYPMHLRARSGLGYLAQERSIFRKLTVEENLLAVMELLKLESDEKQRRLEQLLQEFGIQHVRKIKGYALSGGESRRTEIARALVLEPSIILLDEPFAGVDPIAVADIQAIIRQLAERNIGVLITDHNVRETFGIIDHGYIMNEGELLVNGPPQDLMRDEQARKIYLGDTFSM